MSKCTKSKNPCKICLNTVTNKTGLQCEGACQSWVHYSCLNYTPGKIKDIKAGIIKVTCPCPDCKTSMPKEIRIDNSFSCTNAMCPANLPPKCANTLCPINRSGSPKAPPNGAPCPLGTCGTSCKAHSSPQNPSRQEPKVAPPCNPPATLPEYPMGGSSSSDGCFDPNACPSGCSSDEAPGDRRGRPPMSAPVSTMPSFSAVEQMCNTVGQLTDQINDLMGRMKQAVQEKGGGGQCPSKGPQKGKACPNPCYCPGNPRK